MPKIKDFKTSEDSSTFIYILLIFVESFFDCINTRININRYQIRGKKYSNTFLYRIKLSIILTQNSLKLFIFLEYIYILIKIKKNYKKLINLINKSNLIQSNLLKFTNRTIFLIFNNISHKNYYLKKKKNFKNKKLKRNQYNARRKWIKNYEKINF